MRDQTPQPAWMKHWNRYRRAVLLAGLVAAVLVGIFVSVGLAGLMILVLLGLATFSGGGPSDNGPTSPPSVPGTFRGS